MLRSLAVAAMLAALIAPTAALANCPHFGGTFSSDFGPMKLTAKPIAHKKDVYAVSGTYYWDGHYDTITGTLSGNRLSGQWTQPDRSGYLSLTLLPDASAFHGSWTEANHTGGGGWNGTCTL
jgi:hypothetical protein